MFRRHLPCGAVQHRLAAQARAVIALLSLMWLSSLAVAIGLVWWPADAFAQLQSPRVPSTPRAADTLRLADAIRAAEQTNPVYRIAQLSLTSAEVQVRRSRLAYLPSLTLAAGISGSRATVVTGQNGFGEPIRLDVPKSFVGSGSTQSISFSASLYDGGHRSAQLRIARAGRAEAMAGVAVAQLALRAQVTAAYLAALRSQGLVTVEEAAVQVAQRDLEATVLRLRLASANEVDVLGAKVAVAQESDALARAREDRERAWLMLRKLVGPGIAADAVIEEPAGGCRSEVVLDTTRLLAMGRARNPSIAEAKQALNAAVQQEVLSRAARWPSLSASVSYGRAMSLSSYEALREMNPRNHSIGFGLGASLPISGQIDSRLASEAAVAAREAAKYRVVDQTAETDRAIRDAILSLHASQRALVLADDVADLSRQRAKLAEDSYRLGMLQYTALVDITEAATRAARAVIDARASCFESKVQLETQLGSSLEDAR